MIRSRWILAVGLIVTAAYSLAQAPEKPDAPSVAPAKTPASAPTRPSPPQPTELDADRTPTLVTKGTCLIRGGTLLTVTQGILKQGDILVRDGKIADIGPHLAAPAGATVIDATGKFVTPGIVDAHSHIALDSVNEGADSITAEVDMRDVVDPQSLSLYRGLSNGVTTSLLLHGSANPIGGQSVVVKLKYKHPVEEMFVPDAPRMIKFALGENVTQANFRQRGAARYPASRLGVETVYRRAFAAARNYMAEWDRYEQQKSSDPNAVPPRRDLRLETLADILRGKIWVQCHSYRADEMLMMVRLSQEYHFKLAALHHALEAYRITPEIKGAGVAVSTFADAWAYKVESDNAIPYNAALCTRAGIVTSVNSDNEEGTYRLNTEAANSIKYGGLNPDEALRLVTLNSAIQLGVDRHVGSLERGKDADIAIWAGHPLSVYTKCVMTLIEGEVYYQRRDPFHVDTQSTAATTLPICTTDHLHLPVPPERAAYAIVDATVHPVSGPDIPGGTVVVENGKITAVGKAVTIPSGAYIVHARGLQVYPGLIDAGTPLGLSEVDSLGVTNDTGEQGDYEPDLRAATAVNPASEHLPIARCNGITTSLVRPTGGVISGQASVLNLAGWTAEQMLLDGKAALHINFPEGPGDLTRFRRFLPAGALAAAEERSKAQSRLLTDYFARALRYATTRAQAPDSIAYDPRLEAMIPYVTGKRPVIFNVATPKGVRDVLKFADDNRLKPILSIGTEVWKVADLLASKHVPVIYSVPNDNSLSGTAPREDYDPTDSVWTAPTLLQRAGVSFCFQTGSAPLSKNLPRQVGVMGAYGLSHEAALRALTLDAARILGVADRIGSLDVGKQANLIVTDGDPLEVTTNLHYLFIAGKPIPLTNKHTQFYLRYRERLNEIPGTSSSPRIVAARTAASK